MNDQSVTTQLPTVTFERVLPGPIERVWEYIVDSEKRKTWLAAGEFERHVGGKIELHFDNNSLSPDEPRPGNSKGQRKFTGVITRIEPPRVLAFTWIGMGDSHVTFELSNYGKGVMLRVTHMNLPDRATAMGVTAGWEVHTGILEDKLNGQPPRPFWSTHDKLMREQQKKA